MAINKAYQAPNGVSGNFWVARSAYIAPDYSHSRMFMDLYASQAAYVSGAPALYGADFLLTGVSNAFNLTTVSSLAETRMVSSNGVAPFIGGTVITGFP
jgi:hypothetical protein